MSEFNIREATRSDQKKIVSMVRSENLNPLNIKWENFIVAETSDREIAAISQLKKHRDGTVELASLVVRQDWRGRGLARKLIEVLVKDQERTIYLMCRSGLGDFYSKFGFVGLSREEMPRYFKRMFDLVKAMKVFLGRNESLLIMSLTKH